MLEILFKIILTITLIVILFFLILSFGWIWKSQIDLKETFVHLFKNKIENTQGLFVVRDPNSIYQNGKVVAIVEGGLQETKNEIIFQQIYNAELLNIHEPFEYKRSKCKIINIDQTNITALGIFMNKDTNNSKIKNNVFMNVTCKKIN